MIRYIVLTLALLNSDYSRLFLQCSSYSIMYRDSMLFSNCQRYRVRRCVSKQILCRKQRPACRKNEGWWFCRGISGCAANNETRQDSGAAMPRAGCILYMHRQSLNGDTNTRAHSGAVRGRKAKLRERQRHDALAPLIKLRRRFLLRSGGVRMCKCLFEYLCTPPRPPPPPHQTTLQKEMQPHRVERCRGRAQKQRHRQKFGHP
jgi:hypothetical protein